MISALLGYEIVRNREGFSVRTFTMDFAGVGIRVVVGMYENAILICTHRVIRSTRRNL